jgi:membrane protein YqaA with SNARE-associated domain
MTTFLAYLGLFTIALGAATLLPLQSEAALSALLLAGYSPVPLLVVASAGNIVGSSVNWLLGRWIDSYRDRRWFPVSEAALDRAGAWYRRYGKWTLLLSWVPVIGDPLTLAAGMLREPFPVFLALVAVAKITRYLFVAAATLAWL